MLTNYLQLVITLLKRNEKVKTVFASIFWSVLVFVKDSWPRKTLTESTEDIKQHWASRKEKAIYRPTCLAGGYSLEGILKRPAIKNGCFLFFSKELLVRNLNKNSTRPFDIKWSLWYLNKIYFINVYTLHTVIHFHGISSTWHINRIIFFFHKLIEKLLTLN